MNQLEAEEKARRIGRFLWCSLQEALRKSVMAAAVTSLLPQ